MRETWGSEPFYLTPPAVSAPAPVEPTPPGVDWQELATLERELGRITRASDEDRPDLERLHRRLKQWIDQNGE